MEYNSGSFLSVSSKADQFTSKISSPSNKDLYFSLMKGLLNKNGGPPFWHTLQSKGVDFAIGGWYPCSNSCLNRSCLNTKWSCSSIS